MKTLILRKDLTAKRLSSQLWLFFSKLKINNIYIERISLTLKNNNQEFILIEDINVDKSNIQELQTRAGGAQPKKLIVKNYLNKNSTKRLKISVYCTQRLLNKAKIFIRSSKLTTNMCLFILKISIEFYPKNKKK